MIARKKDESNVVSSAAVFQAHQDISSTRSTKASKLRI